MTSSLTPVQRYALHFHETVLKPSAQRRILRARASSQQTEASRPETTGEDEKEERETKKRKWEEGRMVQELREEMFEDGFDDEDVLLTYDIDLNRRFVDSQGNCQKVFLSQ